MAISKKGMRGITVDDRKYFWKFNKTVTIVADDDQNTFLTIEFGWFDVWLYMNDDDRPPPFEPRAVTPKFVAESIQFAIAAGWTDKNMNVHYKNGTYSTV